MAVFILGQVLRYDRINGYPMDVSFMSLCNAGIAIYWIKQDFYLADPI